MDVRLSGGDIRLTGSGAQELVSGAREAAQRVMIAASVRKGSFVYDRSLGTDYAALDANDPLLLAKLELLLREAAANVAGVQVTLADFDEISRTAVLEISSRGGTVTTEVDLNGYI